MPFLLFPRSPVSLYKSLDVFDIGLEKDLKGISTLDWIKLVGDVNHLPRILFLQPPK